MPIPIAFDIDFPKYDFKWGSPNGKKTIFDVVRKKYVAVTPEEIVRQHLLHYLISERSYPKSLLAVEMAISLHNTARRCDIVAYNQSGAPMMIVECKALEVPLTQTVFDQAARYNLVLKVPYLLISNGHKCYCAKIDLAQQQFVFINDIPFYKDLQ